MTTEHDGFPLGVGDIYEAGLFVEDFTTFLATVPVTHGAAGPAPAPRLRPDRIRRTARPH